MTPKTGHDVTHIHALSQTDKSDPESDSIKRIIILSSLKRVSVTAYYYLGHQPGYNGVMQSCVGNVH